jgi:16S rRNA (uracil1498-N3)-methyltransferase
LLGTVSDLAIFCNAKITEKRQPKMHFTMSSLRRFYAPPEGFQGQMVLLGAEESRHLARVLRMAVGARVVVCDGRGRSVEAEVESLKQGEALLRVVKELPQEGESSLALTLAVGLAKGDALDTLIRQATEMGVKRILVFTSTYSEKTTAERTARRLTRWRRLAQESMKSCQRSCLPQIEMVEDFEEVLAGPEEAKLMFWEDERGGGLGSRLQAPRPSGVRALIGPEGGFSREEGDKAREAGYQVASLGPRRLRVETAALAALALIQFAWGDMS